MRWINAFKSVYTSVIIQTTRSNCGEYTILDLFRHNVKYLGRYAAQLRCEATVFNYLLLWLILCFSSACSYGWMTDNGNMCVDTRGGHPNVLSAPYVKNVDEFHPVDSFSSQNHATFCVLEFQVAVCTDVVNSQQQQLSSHACSQSLSLDHQIS